MINFKNLLKKTLAGAFGVVTMLSPLQSAQCINGYILDDIIKKNNFDIATLPDYELLTIIHEAEEIERNITDGIRACETLILEPDNEDNKNVLNGIRNKLKNNDELYYLVLGEAIRSIIHSALIHADFPISNNARLDIAEAKLIKLIDFIENITDDKKCSSGTRRRIFFNKYKMYTPFRILPRNNDNILEDLSFSHNRHRDDARFGPLLVNLFGLIRDIYEECGETEEIDMAESGETL